MISISETQNWKKWKANTYSLPLTPKNKQKYCICWLSLLKKGQMKK